MARGQCQIKRKNDDENHNRNNTSAVGGHSRVRGGRWGPVSNRTLSSEFASDTLGDDERTGARRVGNRPSQQHAVSKARPPRTVDFSSVKWEWNAARTHLEPDSFPDARVRSGSNVWRRESGTGLIRIFSDTDLSGMSFSTSGSSWPLSMRRAGLYVSNISGDDVERIRAGGESVPPVVESQRQR